MSSSISLEVVQAWNLVKPSLTFSTPTPMVEMKIGSQTRTTKKEDKSLNPIWKETLLFSNPGLATEAKFRVINNGNGKDMGSGGFSLRNVWKNLEFEKWVDVKKSDEKAGILRIKIKAGSFGTTPPTAPKGLEAFKIGSVVTIKSTTMAGSKATVVNYTKSSPPTVMCRIGFADVEKKRSTLEEKYKNVTDLCEWPFKPAQLIAAKVTPLPSPGVQIVVKDLVRSAIHNGKKGKVLSIANITDDTGVKAVLEDGTDIVLRSKNFDCVRHPIGSTIIVTGLNQHKDKNGIEGVVEGYNHDFKTYKVKLQGSSGQTELRLQNAILKESSVKQSSSAIPGPVAAAPSASSSVASTPSMVPKVSIPAAVPAAVTAPPVVPAVVPAAVAPAPVAPAPVAPAPVAPAPVAPAVTPAVHSPAPIAPPVVPPKSVPATVPDPVAQIPLTPSVPPDTPVSVNMSAFDQPQALQNASLPQFSMQSPLTGTDAATQLQILQLQQQLQNANTAASVSSQAQRSPAPVVVRERPPRSSPRVSKSRKNVPLPSKDPKTGLEYVSISAKPSDNDPVIFFAAKVRKNNARTILPSTRIVTVTHTHIILRNEQLAVKRAIAIKNLKQYLYSRDEFTWVGLRESTFDVQLIMSEAEERVFQKVITTLYKSITKTSLRTSSVSIEEMKKKLKIKKPPGWRVVEGEIGTFVTRRSRVDPVENSSGSPTRIPASIQGGSTYINGSPVKSIASRDGLYIISDDEADDAGPPLTTSPPYGAGTGSVQRGRPPPPQYDYYGHPQYQMPPPPPQPVPIQIQQPASQAPSELFEVKSQLEGMKQQMLLQQILAQQQLTNSQLTPSANHQSQQNQPSQQPMSPPPQPKLDANPSASEYVQRITALFELHEPDKSKGSIQQVMEQYLGREKELYSALLDRYRPKPTSPKRPASPTAVPQPKVESPEARPVQQPTINTPQQSFYKAAEIVPSAKVRIDGTVKALFITARYPGDTSLRSTSSLEQFVEDQYRPQTRSLDSESVDLTHDTVINSLRWLGEGTRSGDLLIFAFCGASQNGSILLPTSGENLITPTEFEAILIRDQQRGVRIVCIFDMHPTGSFISLPNRLTIEQGAVSDLPGSLSPAADVVVMSCVGGTSRQPGAFLRSMGAMLSTNPIVTNSRFLETVSLDLRNSSNGVGAVPQIQSSRPMRSSQKLFLHFVVDDGPPTPPQRQQEHHVEIQEPATPIVHTSTSTTATRDSTDGSDIQELVKETFRQADTPSHPNNATAAGTVGSWLLDGSFGVSVDRDKAIKYLTIAADSGDGPAVARLLSLNPQSPVAGVLPSSPQQIITNDFLSLPDTEATQKIRSALATYCATKAPHALAQVTTIVDEYRGRESALLTILLQKYPDWDWPKAEELFFGSNSAVVPITIGGSVLINSDLDKVRESVVNNVSITWDDTMVPYCGSCGTVVAKDQVGNVKVSFPDGRTCWWSADVVSGIDLSNQQSTTSTHHSNDNYIGNSKVLSLEHPQPPKVEKESPVVRIILDHPIMNPVAAIYSMAPLLDIEPTAIQLLPISYSDGALLRIRVDQNVPGHDRIAREIVARCRNQSDTLSVHLGAVSAEFEKEESANHTEVSPPRVINISAPPPALPLDSSGGNIPQTPTSLPRRHTTSSPLPHVSSFGGAGGGLIPARELETRQDAQDRAIFDLQAQVRGMAKRSTRTTSRTKREKRKPSTPTQRLSTGQLTPTTTTSTRRRPKPQSLRDGSNKFASLQKKLYGGNGSGNVNGTVGPLVVQDSEVESPMMVTSFTNFSFPPPLGNEHDEWAVMTEAEKRRELERERHRQQFATATTPVAPPPRISRSISPQRPLSRHSSGGPVGGLTHPTQNDNTAATTAAREVLSILNDDTPPQAFTPQRSTPAASIAKTQNNLMLLRQRESMRKFR